MQETILAKLDTTLKGVTQIKDVLPYPLQGNPEKFPAIVYYQTGIQSNDFNSSKDNYKVYTFNISLILSTSGTTIKDIYTKYMPKLSDKVIDVLDKNWNFGTLDGHRIWSKFTSGGIEFTQEQAGGWVTQNIILEVKCLTEI